MNSIKIKAENGAIIAFCAMNPNQTKDDWLTRNESAIAMGRDDCEIIIQDCDLCLASNVFEQNDPRHEQVRDSKIYYQALNEICEELAEDGSLIFT